MNVAEMSCTVAAKPSNFDYFTERYYHQYLVKNCKNVEDNNCRLLVHSNGLCVLCLDDSHAAVCAYQKKQNSLNDETKPNVSVASVTFGSGRGNSKMSSGSISVVGKRKKNAIKCQEDTKICVIKMTDETFYNIPACIDGFVLEINSAIQERPELILEAPTVEGFIAIISPNINRMNLNKYIKIRTATGGDVVDEEDD